MQRIRPPFLKTGGTMVLTAPAGVVSAADLQAGIDLLSPRYRVRYSDTILAADGYLAGPDPRRKEELQSNLDDPKVHAVMTARGGFGTSRILDQLQLAGLSERPKWIIGSSDITTLLLHLWDRMRLVTIHGPMAATLHRTAAEDLSALTDLLEGTTPIHEMPLTPRVSGNAEGPFIGGNLTMIAHMVGTIDPSAFEHAILFLEDVGEKPYRLDRYLTQLNRCGILTRISGIVLGEFTRCEAPETEESVLDALDRTLLSLNIPVAYGYPAAHGQRNVPFYHGGHATLTVLSNSATLRYGNR